MHGEEYGTTFYNLEKGLYFPVCLRPIGSCQMMLDRDDSAAACWGRLIRLYEFF